MFKMKDKTSEEIEAVSAELRNTRTAMEKAVEDNDPDTYAQLESRQRFLNQRLENLRTKQEAFAADLKQEAVDSYNAYVKRYNHSYETIEKRYNKAMFLLLEVFRDYIELTNEANHAKDELRASVSWDELPKYDIKSPDHIPEYNARAIYTMLKNADLIDSEEADRMKMICNGVYVENGSETIETTMRKIRRKTAKEDAKERARREDVFSRAAAGELPVTACDWLINSGFSKEDIKYKLNVYNLSRGQKQLQ